VEVVDELRELLPVRVEILREAGQAQIPVRAPEDQLFIEGDLIPGEAPAAAADAAGAAEAAEPEEAADPQPARPAAMLSARAEAMSFFIFMGNLLRRCFEPVRLAAFFPSLMQA
jgi:hypothetical protein